MLKLDPEGREYFRWPFYGTDTDIPDISVGGGWVPLTADPDYVPDPLVEPGALWFKALLAGPNAPTPNPDGTIALAHGLNRIKFRVADNPEVVIPTDQQWIQVTR